MNKDEFLQLVNEGIAPESGLRHLTKDDLKLLDEFNFLHPPYYREHVHAAMGWVRYQKEIQDSQEKSGERSQYLFRFIEIYSCELKNPDKETIVYKSLVEQGVSWWSPGRIFVNYSDEEVDQFVTNAKQAWNSYIYHGGEPIQPRTYAEFNEYFRGSVHRVNIEGLDTKTIVYKFAITPNWRRIPSPVMKLDISYRQLYIAFMISRAHPEWNKFFNIHFDVDLNLPSDDAYEREYQNLRRIITTGRLEGEKPPHRSEMVSHYDDLLLPFVTKSHPKSMSDYKYIRNLRFFSWLDFLYFTLIEDLPILSQERAERQIQYCRRCGKILQPIGHRDREYCLRSENPECFRARQRERTSHSRQKEM